MNSDLHSAYAAVPAPNPHLHLQTDGHHRPLHYGSSLQQQQQQQNLPSLQSSVYRQPNSGSQTPQSPATPNSAQHHHQQQQQSLNHSSFFSGNHSLMNTASPTTMMDPHANGQIPRLPDIRPMPLNTGQATSSLSRFTTSVPQHQQQPHAQQQQSFASSHTIDTPEASPTHVVGSQGRRGILPTAPGRAAPVAGSPSGPGKTQLERDSEGKFPCPCCNKTYLHQKHLKRHYLRHTGDRPYQCHLCLDTFSRSDILKRHFQKCSVRRGNPTGASHLTNAHAHRRGQNSQNMTSTGHRRSLSAVGDQTADDAGGMGPPPVNGANHMGMENGSYYGTSYSTPASRSNSLVGLNNLGHSFRHSVSGGSQLSSNRQSYDYSNDAHIAQLLASENQNASAAMSTHLHNRGGMTTAGPYGSTPALADRAHASRMGSGAPVHSGQHASTFPSGVNAGYDWNSLFTSGPAEGNELYTSPLDHKPSNEALHSQLHSPTEGSHDPLLSSLYGQVSDLTPAGGLAGPPLWSLDMIADDSLQSKANALLNFALAAEPAFPHEWFASTGLRQELHEWLTIANLRHCVERYTHFHAHWPLLHTPTFDLLTASDALALAVLAIGAVYSDRAENKGIRGLIDALKFAVQRQSRVWALALTAPSTAFEPLPPSAADLEDMQALILLHVLCLWHGSAKQRQAAQHDFNILARLASRFALFLPASLDQPGASLLHQPGPVPYGAPTAFDWSSWITQEQRARVMYFLYLSDAAQTIFFNVPPHLDALMIRHPLPADDAAWEAASAADCLSALGLNGHEAQGINTAGSRQAKQEIMADVLILLLEPHHHLPRPASNAFAKFILMHALHVLVWLAQRRLAMDLDFGGQPAPALGRAASFPDWPTATSSGPTSGAPSADSSGPVTPIESLFGEATSQQRLRLIWLALDRWKLAWDADLQTQYAPHNAPPARRFGFSRDAIHFFYLAKHLIQHASPSETLVPADTRLQMILRLLQTIRHHLLAQTGAHVHQLGSVTDIDDRYGIDDLTLNMRLLFKPLPELDEHDLA